MNLVHWSLTCLDTFTPKSSTARLKKLPHISLWSPLGEKMNSFTTRKTFGSDFTLISISLCTIKIGEAISYPHFPVSWARLHQTWEKTSSQPNGLSVWIVISYFISGVISQRAHIREKSFLMDSNGVWLTWVGPFDCSFGLMSMHSVVSLFLCLYLNSLCVCPSCCYLCEKRHIAQNLLCTSHNYSIFEATIKEVVIKHP